MQFITSLFGGDGNNVLTMVFALGAVLVLIVLVIWLLKLVFNASGTAVRGRNRRLAVVDTLNLDQKRQLVIVRRDNIEHLILTGGAQDLVVESGIPVEEQPAPQSQRRPLPMVNARKPADAKPAPASIPAAARPKAEPTRPAAPAQAARSLRHTGLLRPFDDRPSQDPAEHAAPEVQTAQDGTEQANEGGALDHDTGSQSRNN